MAFSNFDKLHFLVIDDSGFTRKMMRNALTANGAISIEEAPDAVEGLKILKNADNEIDFILVDQEMPVLDGVDFTRMVRKDKSLPNSTIPIVMVTALASKSLVRNAAQAGVNAFVAKPFSPEQLAGHIQAVLDSRQTGAAKKQEKASAISERLKQLTVLLIDDSSVARKIAMKVLNEVGVTKVLEAADGASAISILKEKSKDIGLILVDREMPVINGLEFTQMVRSSQEEDYSQMPIIMVSGLAEDEQIMEAREAGVTSFVAKPYAPQELKIQIQFAIRDPRTLS